MPPNQKEIAEETAKRVVRKATKLQPRQISQLLTPYLLISGSVGESSKVLKKNTSPLVSSASSSGTTGSKDFADGAERDFNDCSMIRLCTDDGESLCLDCQWGTRLEQDDTDWVFQLFRQNMRNFYLKSQWGYDECIKLQELQATTARFLILRNPQSRPVGYAHFRFVEDDSRAVLYCYEIQVEKDYQKRGVGTILIRMLEQLGKGAQVEALMSTVFAFNGPSLAFFHKLDFRADRTCLFGKDCGKNCEGRDFVILYKRLDGKEDPEEDGKEDNADAVCCANAKEGEKEKEIKKKNRGSQQNDGHCWLEGQKRRIDAIIEKTNCCDIGDGGIL